MLYLYHDFGTIEERSFRNIHTQNPAARALVLKDLRFLPEGVDSVFDLFLVNPLSSPRDVPVWKISVPKFWQWKASSYLNFGHYIDQGQKKAVVFYRRPYEMHMADYMEWLDARGRVYQREFYNKYGFVYKKEILGEDQEVRFCSYCKADGEEILCWNLSNGSVLLHEKGSVRRIFLSLSEAVEYMAGIISAEKQGV